MAQSPSPESGKAAAPVVLLIAGGELGAIMVNGLAQHLGAMTVIEEVPEPKSMIIRRRARLLGWPAAIGQIGFGLFHRATAGRSRNRLAAICREHGLDTTPRTSVPYYRVASVNAPECHVLLRELAPRVVAVYGTRLLSAATLAAVDAPFINYHAGITPNYRGQHPAYWARVNGELELAGITIHLVDKGVDTGAMLYQSQTTFSTADTIATYQYVQMAQAVPLFARAIADACAGRLVARSTTGTSANHFPPTLWRYLSNGLRHGVW